MIITYTYVLLRLFIAHYFNKCIIVYTASCGLIERKRYFRRSLAKVQKKKKTGEIRRARIPFENKKWNCLRARHSQLLYSRSARGGNGGRGGGREKEEWKRERVGWQRDTHGNLNCIGAWRERKTHIAPRYRTNTVLYIPCIYIADLLNAPARVSPPMSSLPPVPQFSHPLSVTRAYAFTTFYHFARFFFFNFPLPSLTSPFNRPLSRKYAGEKKIHVRLL